MEKIKFLLSYIIGAILLFSGIIKIFSFRHFLNVVNSYNIIPTNWVPHLSGILIFIEILLGTLLFTKKYREIGAFISTILISFFLIISIYSTVQGSNIECGCFGPLSGKVADVKHFALLIFLMTGSIFIFMKSEHITIHDS